GLRKRQGQSLRGLEIDDQLEFGRLLHGQVAGLGALQDLVDVRGGTPVEITEARPVRHEAPGLHVLPIAVCCRQAALCCEVCKPCSVEAEYPICQYEECSHAVFGHRRGCAVELVGTWDLEELYVHYQQPGPDVHVSYRRRVARIGRVREDRHTVDLGDGLLEQLQ